MSICYFNEDVLCPVFKKRMISKWIKDVIISEGKKVGEISFIFCSDNYLFEINKKYLNHDYLTDIVTFDYVEGVILNGDIFISIDRVCDNAKMFSTSTISELQRVLVHGILHLSGYKDKSKKDKILMTSKEDFYLKVLVDSCLF